MKAFFPCLLSPLGAYLLACAPVDAELANAAWMQQNAQAKEELIALFRQSSQEVEEAIASLGGLPESRPSGSSENKEEGGKGQSSICAEQGMLFDPENARATYIGNVQLRHERLHINAKDKLYIQLPPQNFNKLSKDSSKDKGEAPPSDDSNSSGDRKTAAAPPSGDEKAATPEESAVAPVYAELDSAFADCVNNRLYLLGRDIRLKDSQRSARILADAGQQATVLADSNGDILINGKSFVINLVDSAGKNCCISSQSGQAYFNAELNCLSIEGPCHISHPDGDFECQEQALISLIPDERAAKPTAKSGELNFMGQFLAMRFQGVAEVHAKGQVVATRSASEGQEAAEARGDELFYNARNGQCRLQGSPCLLRYGANRLESCGSLHLEENGDILLRGGSILGYYERPSQSGNIITGRLSAQNELRFDAATGCISSPQGLQAEDSEGHFSCSGPVRLQLEQAEKVRFREEDRAKLGMLKLSILNYSGIRAGEMEGDVQASFKNKEQEAALCGDSARFDLSHGSARISARNGQQALVCYQGHNISAQSPQGEAILELFPSGDLSATGKNIEATVHNSQGNSHISCQDYLKLEKKEELCLVGPRSTFRSDSGIFSAHGPLRLRLAKDESKKAPKSSRYPLPDYSYAGIHSAETNEGGSLQSPKGSMECRGRIWLSMDPHAGKDAEMAGLRQAEAEGQVGLLSKDKDGRIMKAEGDRLSYDAATGCKRLSGNSVILSDAYNRHCASGKDAAIVIDRNNNVRISGGRQSTTARRIPEQIKQQKKKN